MTTPAFPAGRYGRRRRASRKPRWLIGALVCVVIAATLSLAVAAYQRQTSEVQASVRTYTVLPREVRVTFEVRKPRGQPATCILRARDSDGAVVGQAEVAVPAAPNRVTLTHTVPTGRLAVTGEVLRCSSGSG